jgi:hypothetical protein
MRFSTPGYLPKQVALFYGVKVMGLWGIYFIVVAVIALLCLVVWALTSEDDPGDDDPTQLGKDQYLPK